MATFPSNSNRFQPSSQPSRIGPGVVTTVTPPMLVPNRQPVPRPSIGRSLAKEPEDAGLTGGTRSLDRRLLALNFAELPSRIKAVPERPFLPRHPAAA